MARTLEPAGLPQRSWGSGHRPLLWQPVGEAAVRMREIEPWTALLDEARGDQRLVGEAFEHARAARFADLPPELHPELSAQPASGRDRRASTATRCRRSRRRGAGPTMVTTGTASGKSLCFNLPTLDVLLRDAKARALYLYPTKALAQDQARAIGALGLARAVRPAIYDGDTPREARNEIRRKANLILTNPDMLHLGILPHHDSWAQLFANLAVVVVDEAHVYRGVFGSTSRTCFRRLRRIAAAYGTEPRFLLASATIANPVELAERLTGLEEVTLDRARRRPGRPAPDRGLEPAAHRRGARPSPLGARRRRRAARPARGRGGADDLLRALAQGRRAAAPDRPRRARAARRGLARASWSCPTARATPRRSGARSSSG